jgi:hypothetical protein
LRVERFTTLIEEQACERARSRLGLTLAALCCLFAQLFLNSSPQLAFEDRVVQTQMAFPLVADLADVDRVGEQLV